MKRLTRFTTLLIASLITLLWFSGPVFAQTASTDLRGDASRLLFTPYYSPNDPCAGTSATISVGGATVTLANGDDPVMSPFWPNFPDEAAVVSSMEAFIRKVSPNSPWLNIPNFATRFVAEGKRLNVNPLMVVVIGRQESGIGTSPVARRNNNSYGNKGNPDSNGDGYREWANFEASLFGEGSFTAAVRDRLSGKSIPYRNVTNMYEYLSVHLTGQIMYPGDSRVVNDPLMGNQAVSIQNVLDYWHHAQEWIGEMTGKTITGDPTGPSSTTPTSNPCATSARTGGGSGLVNPDGYAFPVSPQTKISYSTLPCTTRNAIPSASGYAGRLVCHHDGTPAFDLMFGSLGNMDGRAVYAISDGTVVSVKNINNIPECFAIQFESSKDNFFYWYGHLQNPKVTANQTVRAGDQIAEVARNSLGSGCRGGRDHLHIDRGCIRNGVPQHGGSDPCRDPDFVPFMNAMWEILPAGGSGGGPVAL